MPTEVFGKQIDPASVGAEPAAPQPPPAAVPQAQEEEDGSTLHVAAMRGWLDRPGVRSLLTPESLALEDTKGRTVYQVAQEFGHLGQIPEAILAQYDLARAAEKVRQGIKADLKAKKPMPPLPKHTGPDRAEPPPDEQQKPPQRGMRV